MICGAGGRKSLGLGHLHHLGGGTSERMGGTKWRGDGERFPQEGGIDGTRWFSSGCNGHQEAPSTGRAIKQRKKTYQDRVPCLQSNPRLRDQDHNGGDCKDEWRAASSEAEEAFEWSDRWQQRAGHSSTPGEGDSIGT